MSRRAALLGAALLLSARAAAAAEGDEEILDDPLLHAGTPGPASPAPAKAVGPAAQPPPPRPRIWHAEIVGRAATQAHWDPGEDVMELRARARMWAEDRPSPELSWSLGVRFDSLSRTRREGGAFVDGAYTFEARPWEAWVDVALTDRLRLRVGNQIIAWGRLDLASAADVLAVSDFREGAVLDPDALRMPTPSVRATWVASESASLEVAYTPFFVADRFDVAGTNWAMVGPNSPAAARAILQKMRLGLDATSFARVQDQLLVVGAPTARPDAGEAGARGVLHARGLDVGLTYGFVRSKVPTLAIDPALAGFLAKQDLVDALAVQTALADNRQLIAAQYDRYHQLALDVEGVAGPLTLSTELGFTPSRPLYLLDPATGLPIAKRSGLAQAGTKAAWIHGDDLLLSLEVGGFATTNAPPDGQEYMLMGGRRALAYALVMLHAEPLDHHELDAAVTATSSDPWSVAMLARWLYRLSDPIALGIGGVAFAGPRGDKPTVASLTRGLDEVYLYLQLRP